MSHIAVRIEGLGKQYFIGGRQQRYRTFRDAIVDTMTAPIQRVRNVVRGRGSSASGQRESIWALKDVSFDVKPGEVVGIIGRNGAGKSTLLKILSRITEPTVGSVKVNGRVGALLEVGTGFHPELTGRENIYLNAAILGMKRHEIDRKFDEIVAFAEIDQFIDTPVKRYSSGMGLRLGFAVAAHLEPEILIIDEVLAVGDAEFQKKCLGKMSDIAGEGRTVLFVSHNMGAVNNLCSKTAWIHDGQIKTYGETSSVLEAYLNHAVSIQRTVDLTDHKGRSSKYTGHMCSVQIVSINNSNEPLVKTFDPFAFEVTFQAPGQLAKLSLGFVIKDFLNNRLFASNMRQYDEWIEDPKSDISKVTVLIDSLPFSPGIYNIDLYLGTRTSEIDVVYDAISFEVAWNNDLHLAFPPLADWGPLFSKVRWSIEKQTI